MKSITEILPRIVRLDRTDGGNDGLRNSDDKQMLGKIDKGLGLEILQIYSWNELNGERLAIDRQDEEANKLSNKRLRLRISL